MTPPSLNPALVTGGDVDIIGNIDALVVLMVADGDIGKIEGKLGDGTAGDMI